MNDYAIFVFLRTLLLAGFDDQGIPGAEIQVLQKNQPVGQGADTGQVIYIQKITGNNYGFPEVKDTYNAGSGKFDTTTAFMKRPMFQISGLAPQDPNIEGQLTASDIVELASYILQTDSAVKAFQDAGMGIERITGIREHYFSDEKEQYEQYPSFDVILSYTKEFTVQTDKLTAAEVEAHRV